MMRSVLSQSIQPSRELMLSASDCRQGVGGDGSCALLAAAESGERYAAYCSVGAGGGWAFFSVLQYPGWVAAVDGQDAELVPANIAFYAVPLSAGPHHVELLYHSRGLSYGLWIAGATGIVALGLAGWSVRARRRSAVTQRADA
jgi:predicted MFS family arabinose efflux permease